MLVSCIKWHPGKESENKYYLTVSEFADLLNVSRQHVYIWLQTKKIPDEYVITQESVTLIEKSDNLIECLKKQSN